MIMLKMFLFVILFELQLTVCPHHGMDERKVLYRLRFVTSCCTWSLSTEWCSISSQISPVKLRLTRHVFSMMRFVLSNNC